MQFGRIFLVFILFSSLFTSPASAGDNAKVSLGLYYESLCPYSAKFIVNHLAKIFNDGIIDIVNLDLIPYGNARVKSNSTITCQHGPNECLLNTIEACAISAWPDLIMAPGGKGGRKPETEKGKGKTTEQAGSSHTSRKQQMPTGQKTQGGQTEHFKFIYCVENLVLKHKYRDWESCFQETGLNSEAVFDCYHNGNGEKLELKYAAQTNALQPPHKYVPWVVVNGQPLYEDYEDFEVYICDAYRGDSPPRICAGLTVLTTKEKEASREHHVSLIDGAL